LHAGVAHYQFVDGPTRRAAVARPALEQDLDVDVAIIGAGYTGLWTAYYLKRQAPG
jgi:ribulose 1,5-bisphosphate synthetase/thiazole synthase